jgi:hypothetical protein
MNMFPVMALEVRVATKDAKDHNPISLKAVPPYLTTTSHDKTALTL